MTTPQLRKGRDKNENVSDREVSRTVEQTSYVEVEAEDRESAIDEAETKAQDMDDSNWEFAGSLGLSGDIETGSVEVLEMEDDDVDDGDPDPEEKNDFKKEESKELAT